MKIVPNASQIDTICNEIKCWPIKLKQLNLKCIKGTVFSIKDRNRAKNQMPEDHLSHRLLNFVNAGQQCRIMLISLAFRLNQPILHI